MKKEDVILGDCLEEMQKIPDKSIDMILCDLPYGTTACKWDAVIPFEYLWEQYERVIKPNGAILLTSAQPFTSALIMSNPKLFKYEWIWCKNTGTGFAGAKYQPLRYHESILVFSKGTLIYNPQPTQRLNARSERSHQLPHTNKPRVGHTGITTSVSVQYDPKNKNPESLLYFDSVPNSGGKKLHPTQKPVALFEYLIKTYTNEGDLVLDNCAGSGTTGIAARNLKRNFILIEKEPEYYEIIKKRLATPTD